MIFERFLRTEPDPDYTLAYELVKKFEGLRLKAYLCQAGVPTIGYGATGRDIFLGLTWTKQKAEKRLESDLKLFLDASRELCPNATVKQQCVIASFAYNVGISALKTSTFRKRFNAGDIEGAKKQLLRWNKANGVVSKGLTTRRQIESSLL